jgi:hypothetical protein
MQNDIRRAAAIAITFLLLQTLSKGAETVWKDETGKLAKDTEYRKAKDGFGGWLVVTPDTDWKKKWETSPETVPRFTTTNTVERGKELYILLFFTNPKVGQNGEADVSCDIRTIRPDGSLSVDQKNIPCLRGRLGGDPLWIRLAPPVIKFVGEPKDLAGKWTVHVTLKDNLRRVVLQLTTSFTLK